MNIIRKPFKVNSKTTVSAIEIVPDDPFAVVILAHGAGAGIDHQFMAAIAETLADHQLITFRFNFPYLEEGRKLPGSPKPNQEAIRSATELVSKKYPKLPLFLGGKSYGGRMASQLIAKEKLSEVAGLIFYGFPLHPPGKPSMNRAEHLNLISIPMLFLQGEKDALANKVLITDVTNRLGKMANLHLYPQANHTFHCPAKSGISDQQMIHKLASTTNTWLTSLPNRR